MKRQPIGLDPQTKLLWEISKQLDKLTKIMGKIASTITTTTTTIP